MAEQDNGMAIVKSAKTYMATPEFQDTVMESLSINEDEFNNSLYLTLGALKTNAKFKRGEISVKQIMEGIIRAGRDGLVCDGREAALVPYGSDLQYIPMVSGLIKRAYQTGKIESITAEVVYENDPFDYELGDNAFITHKKLLKGDRGERYAAYASIKMMNGGIIRKVMTKDDIEKIRIEFSQAGGDAKSGPKGIWAKHPDAQWEKTAVRLALKRAPLSSKDQKFFQTTDDDIVSDPLDPVDTEPPPPVTPTAPTETSPTTAAEKLKAKAEEKTPPAGDGNIVDAEVVDEKKADEPVDFI